MGYERINERLEEIGMTTRFLSIRTKIPEREILQMIKGSLEISRERAYLLSDVLKVNYSDLIPPHKEGGDLPEEPDYENYEEMVLYITYKHNIGWSDIIEHTTNCRNKRKVRTDGTSIRGAAIKARFEIYSYLDSLGWDSVSIGKYCNRDGSSVRNYLTKRRVTKDL